VLPSKAQRPRARSPGVKLVNSGRPTRNFAEFFSQLKKLQFIPGTIIDVGVAWGTPDLYEAFPASKFYLVEPLKDSSPTWNA